MRVEFGSAEQRRAVLDVLTESAALPNDVTSTGDYLTAIGATVGFDAIGGGRMTNQILAAMDGRPYLSTATEN